MLHSAGAHLCDRRAESGIVNSKEEEMIIPDSRKDRTVHCDEGLTLSRGKKHQDGQFFGNLVEFVLHFSGYE